ncbi:phosphoesterase [Gordoniibacillus kamchatkensis]|uniref:Phosphoesterase n=1 Tax=Gordoniibacillus kamchatkensis TaxID=1590651 RepID=A0ABR5AFT9_9BACL|nr:CehA/McbA family metallohydrolase [Paenibacillus sp. VKM B-2647]KIL39815.1 phosphoesterase [Paenibacillus sp. VKM B-2647]
MEQQQKVTVLTVRRDIRKDEESRYIEIPFELPEGVEEIRVSYDVESRGEPKAVIDLGVRDRERVRGWSGGARTEFRLGLEKATPGYSPGPLAPGEWAVLHNAYKVPADGCTVIVTVQSYHQTPRWLKGDLHMHSVHSDGSYTLEDNARIMEELGCDFLAMTDHNTSSQNAAYPRQTEVVMIPGLEFTTNFGHSNFLGVPDPLDDFRVSGMDDVHRRIRTGRERGAKIVLNHPHCPNCPWLWDFDVDFDWVEIWNGPWREMNQATLDWWHAQLVAGRRLTAVGGSDTHRPDPYVRHACPTTWVLSETKTVHGILGGIDRGHVVLSYAPDGPFVELRSGTYGIGDAVPAGTVQEVTMAAERLRARDRIRLIDNRGTALEHIAEEDGALTLLLPAAEGRTFCRAEVWRHFDEAGKELLAAVTNAIYFD